MKLRGDLHYEDDQERKVIQRGCKLVPIKDIESLLKDLSPFVFIEEGELLLEGNSETVGSFLLTIPSESRVPFFLEALYDKALVPLNVSAKTMIQAFAKNVVKSYKMTQAYVV
jgi:hypothetical protein